MFDERPESCTDGGLRTRPTPLGTPPRIPDGNRTRAAGRVPVPVHQVFGLDQIQDAHAVMEGNEAAGDLVVRATHPSA